MTDPKGTDPLSITLGVEEEFFLVDPATRDLLPDPDPRIFEYCDKNRGDHKVVAEFLRSQIETTSRVCTSVEDVRSALMETRRLVIDAASQHGAGVMAASTHPFAAWQHQVVTAGHRYEQFAMTYQQAVRELLVGGLHIHAGFGDEDSRVRVMTAMRRYLPLLHALSASSPFSSGRETGFKSYRLTLFGSMPRTGLPGPLHSWKAEFDSLVDDFRRMEFIKDSSELWWDIRPSRSFPTLELRICDICQTIDDAMSVVALYACLVRNLLRRALEDRLPPEPPTELIEENCWLAQRYGVVAFLGDTEGSGRLDIDEYAGSLVEELADDAQALGCEDELRHILEVIRYGTGADRQIDHYRLRRLEGDSEEKALRAVVDLVVEETRTRTGYPDRGIIRRQKPFAFPSKPI